MGADIECGKVMFEELETYMLKKGDVEKNVSGRQEMLENVINRYLK
jgi:xylose isomerase